MAHLRPTTPRPSRAASVERMDSSVLSGVRYLRDRKILEVRFRTGRIYHYFDVPPAIHARGSIKPPQSPAPAWPVLRWASGAAWEEGAGVTLDHAPERQGLVDVPARDRLEVPAGCLGGGTGAHGASNRRK